MAHILVVEDSPTDQYVIQSLLEAEGHMVSTATTADEGIELARALQPDLITMDIVFEGQRGTSGFMGVRRIKRDPESAEIPVIIISSKSQPTDMAWALRQGASEYLVKPVTAEKLMPLVNALLPAAAAGSQATADSAGAMESADTAETTAAQEPGEATETDGITESDAAGEYSDYGDYGESGDYNEPSEPGETDQSDEVEDADEARRRSDRPFSSWSDATGESDDEPA